MMLENYSHQLINSRSERLKFCFGYIQNVVVKMHLTVICHVFHIRYANTIKYWVVGLGDGAGCFHCRGVLLLLQILGQGPAVLAAGAGRVGYIYIYFPSIFHF